MCTHGSSARGRERLASPHATRRPARSALGGILAALTLACGTLTLPLDARAAVFEGFPDVVVCDGGEVGFVAFYVSFRLGDGSVTYRAQVKEPLTIKITAERRVETDRIFCSGETVDGLRKAGRAFDFNPS
ncbi:MAG: hypothetical protein QNK04_25525 [Myxococcota bacterium]|nr:hypothetical protein [Myxococcota bacterium]